MEVCYAALPDLLSCDFQSGYGAYSFGAVYDVQGLEISVRRFYYAFDVRFGDILFNRHVWDEHSAFVLFKSRVRLYPIFPKDNSGGHHSSVLISSSGVRIRRRRAYRGNGDLQKAELQVLVLYVMGEPYGKHY